MVIGPENFDFIKYDSGLEWLNIFLKEKDMAAANGAHRWKFFRYGGLDQVSLETAEDLRSLEQLDPKLWAAMTCPTNNIEFDRTTLDYIDADKDRRIKIPELLAALKWVCSMVKNPEVLIKPAEAMPLDIINQETAEGKALYASARQILNNLGKGQETSIALADLADTKKIFAANAFNGDGIVPADISSDEKIRQAIADIIACLGSETDRSGLPGISQALLDKFMVEASAYVNWQKQAEEKAADIMFAGADTPALASVYLTLKPRIDDYFVRCRLAAYDSKFAAASANLESEFVAVLKKSLSTSTPELKELPLAVVSLEGSLPLTDKVNPAWALEINEFAAKIAKPYAGGVDKLTESGWLAIKNRFAAYEAWQAQKTGAAVEKFGLARLKELLAADIVKNLGDLIAKDKAVEAEFNAISNVDRLVRYYRFIYQLLSNFVVFKDFYGGKNKAVFQAGTLFMDSRSCDLAVKVEDLAKHSTMAAACNTFLVYCDCVRQGSSEKMTVAAAFTDGDSDQLTPGRNGLFVDRAGNYWDATIVKIIDHPISIRQAFWAPYKRLGRMIHEQIEKFAASKDKSMTDSLSASVNDAGAKIEAPKPDAPPPPPFDAGKFAGIFAAIGLALAAVGSAVASVVSGFMSLTWWQMPLAVIGILLLISGPSMLMAALRLRQRNLGAILDANGWAVNTRAQINMAFGKTLTKMAELPAGAIRSFDDPFAEKKTPWGLYLALILVLSLLAGAIASPIIRNRAKIGFKRIFGMEVKKPADCKPLSAGKTADKAAPEAPAGATAPTTPATTPAAPAAPAGN